MARGSKWGRQLALQLQWTTRAQAYPTAHQSVCTQSQPALRTPRRAALLGAGDGAISEEDMTLILRQLAGSSLSEAEVGNLVRRVFAAAGASTERGLTFPEYREALAGTNIGLQVEIPVED